MTISVGVQPSIHASCVVIGERGVIIRGESGSGKSTLARHLISHAKHSGTFASLVSDDRLYLLESNGRLIASCHPTIAGKIEVRGVGILETEFERSCIIRLVVDCSKQVRLRSPEDEDRMVSIRGVQLPRIETLATEAELVLSILEQLEI